MAGSRSHIETEVKFRVAGPGAARLQLERIGATLAGERHFEDNLLLDDADSTLAKREATLRLRRIPGRALLTYKGPRKLVEGVKSRSEIEVTVGDPDAFLALLGNLGYRAVFRYQKYREVYAWEDAEIVIDETPVGTFLEVEGRVESIHKAAAALGYNPEDYVVDSYVALFFAAGGRSDMIFK